MKFEWDARKSIANRGKHGIDFETARALWLDENRIEIEAPHPVEERRILIAHLHGKPCDCRVYVFGASLPSGSFL